MELEIKLRRIKRNGREEHNVATMRKIYNIYEYDMLSEFYLVTRRIVRISIAKKSKTEP